MLRWMNHHLKAAGYTRIVANFGPDLENGEVPAALFCWLTAPSI